MIERPCVDPKLFPLDPETVFLNHGSFGSCPLAVLDYQNEIRLRLERQSVQFYQRDFEPLLDEARAAVGEFVGAQADDLVFVDNATSGVNTVLRSIPIEPGDELLVSNHEYNACSNALRYAAEKRGAKAITVEIPFPIKSPDEVIEAAMSKVTDKTRLLLIDHVTSQTGLVLPIEPIIRALAERGIDTLVDGAHAPGMIPLNIERLGAAYYTGNCHKWISGPKTAAFLYVQPDKQHDIRPLTISHGANSPRTDRSRLQIEFGWMGTRDPSAALSVPFTIDYIGGLHPEGWAGIRKRNRALTLAARTKILDALNQSEPAPESMIGSLASIPLEYPSLGEPYQSLQYQSKWQETLVREHNIELPLFAWPEHPKHIARISCHLYNALPQYELLAERLEELSAQG